MKSSNVDFLIQAETRANSIDRYQPYSQELPRLWNAMCSIRERFTEADEAEYLRRKNFVESADEKMKRNKAELLAMESNRDRESI